MKAHWLAALPLSLLVSCSGYQRDFKRAVSEYQPAQSPTGPWKGTWKSEVNGHHGPLWCIVSSDDLSPQTWHFRYRAGWGVLRFGDYTHSVATKLKPDESLPLDASMTLPNNFGTYAVKGPITPTQFKVRFEGNGDKGTMTLSRPPSP
ncbi:MAG: hypothetical protein QNL33_10195 [Akkermansiaceae bacterium]|jgi:hypothetical protein